jgi:hypothetical protein
MTVREIRVLLSEQYGMESSVLAGRFQYVSEIPG